MKRMVVLAVVFLCSGGEGRHRHGREEDNHNHKTFRDFGRPLEEMSGMGGEEGHGGEGGEEGHRYRAVGEGGGSGEPGRHYLVQLGVTEQVRRRGNLREDHGTSIPVPQG